MKSFAIGALSEKTGVKIPTIRYYESNGLLPAAARTDTNRRSYDDATVRRLKFIRSARALGFEVDAIRTLLDLADQPDLPCAEVDAITRRHLADIDDRLARLSTLREAVQATVDQCERGRIGHCRVIEVLADHEPCVSKDL